MKQNGSIKRNGEYFEITMRKKLFGIFHITIKGISKVGNFKTGKLFEEPPGEEEYNPAQPSIPIYEPFTAGDGDDTLP